MVRRAREAHLLSVDREDIPLNVVVIPSRCKSSRVGGGDGSELWTATGKWSGDGRDSQIVNHPPLVPTTLIIDHEKPRDVGEDVDECPHIIGIRRQTGLGLQNDPHSADRSEEHTSELQSHLNLVCRLLLEKKKQCIEKCSD